VGHRSAAGNKLAEAKVHSQKFGGRMRSPLKVGNKVRHADFDCVGTVTEIFIGGAEAFAEFGDERIYFEPV
jgi:hypothetical protein